MLGIGLSTRFANKNPIVMKQKSYSLHSDGGKTVNNKHSKEREMEEKRITLLD